MSTPPRERRWWTKREDDILQHGAQAQIDKQGSVKNWNELASLLPGRTNKDCRKRWYKVRLDIRKGSWTPEEDERIRAAIAQVGLKWTSVSKIMKTRNADQCAKRWQHVLGPDTKHAPWTPEEDRILQNAIAKYGHKWKQIRLSELPDRSTHDIRNRSVALSRRPQRPATAATPLPSSPGSNDDTSDDDESVIDSSEDEVDTASKVGSRVTVSGADLNGASNGFEPTEVPATLLDDPMGQVLHDWDMSDATALIQHPPPLNAEYNSWPQLEAPGMDPALTGILEDIDFDVGAMNEEMMGDMTFSDDGPLETGEPENTVGPGPKKSDRTHEIDTGRGNVTVFVKGDSVLKQEVLRSLASLDVELTIHLQKE